MAKIFPLWNRSASIIPPAESLQQSPRHDIPAASGNSSWLKVLGCFFAFMNTWGIASTFDTYQAYYQNYILSSYSPSSISWIGTLQVFLLGFTGIFTSSLYDHRYTRTPLSVGCFLLMLSHFAPSLAHKFYLVLLSQGICIRIGTYV